MGWDAPWHWVIIAILVIALFGYKKLPDASRALGRSLRIFKTEIKGMSDDDRAREAAQQAARETRDPAQTRPAVAPPAQQAQPAPSVGNPAGAHPADRPVTTPGVPPLTKPVPPSSANGTTSHDAT